MSAIDAHTFVCAAKLVRQHHAVVFDLQDFHSGCNHRGE
jgi:hypothetical protein